MLQRGASSLVLTQLAGLARNVWVKNIGSPGFTQWLVLIIVIQLVFSAHPILVPIARVL